MKTKYDHLSKEDLINQLVKRDSERKLGLVWERDQIEHEREMNDDFVALDFIPEHSVGVAPFQNLLIEGDNFDALRYLSIAYKGKVKCICIDPPYNTGNRDFIYNDRFLDKEDSWKHSKWLEFMYRRLDRAKELLADNGVILVCINDENRAKLELLMDQVFPDMRVGSLVWRKRRPSNAANMDNFFSSDHEHVLIFSTLKFEFAGSEKTWNGYKNWDEEKQDWWASGDLTLGFNREQRPNLYYPLYNPKTDIWYPSDPNNVWRYATSERLGERTVRTQPMENMIAENRIYFPDESSPACFLSIEDLESAITTGKTPPFLSAETDKMFWIGKHIGFNKPRFKRFKQDLKRETQPLSSWIAEVGKSEKSNSYELETGMTAEGTKALRVQGLATEFSYPKPPSLIRELVRQSTNGDDLVLDFFAGSGTTAQAVLELNNEDQQSRRFIMVSSTEATAAEPDKNICRDVCSKRIKGVIEGYGTTPGSGGNFAYLRTRRLPFETLHLEIQHDQVWYALQLIHSGGISPYSQDDAIQKSESEKSIILYLPKLSPVTIDAVLETADKTATPTVIYTWQPGTLAPQIHNELVTIEKIPEYLVQRFGGGDT